MILAISFKVDSVGLLCRFCDVSHYWRMGSSRLQGGLKRYGLNTLPNLSMYLNAGGCLNNTGNLAGGSATRVRICAHAGTGKRLKSKRGGGGGGSDKRGGGGAGGGWNDELGALEEAH